MAYEVLTAFFLEAGFLGVMLFGLERVGKKLHFVATCMVALGTFISAFWILIGEQLDAHAGWLCDNEQGQFVPGGSWLTIIFNPSFPYRLVHTVIAAYLTTALVVGGVGAWHLLKARRRGEQATQGVRTMFSMAMWMAALVAPLQIVVGDFHGLNTLEHQPAKVMAMEGHYENYPNGAPLILFGLPDDRGGEGARRDRDSEAVLLHSQARHECAAERTEEHAEVRASSGRSRLLVFRIMVGLGFLMLALGLFSLLARFRKKLFDWPLLHRFALVMAPSGFVAVIAGWITTEVGRQPYVIYGLMRTADAVAPIGAAGVAGSLIAFVIVYFIVFGIGTWYILKLMGHQPHHGESGLADAPIRTAASRPHRLCTGRAEPTVGPIWRRRSDGPHRHLGVPDRLCGRRLCRHGRVRSWHRHPVSRLHGRQGTGSGDERDRAGLGRQRDLAGAGRRGAACRLSACLCDHPAGPLRAADRDAARPCLPRRRL
jgi:cytochrome d ubiquinol oxidase subunit I